MKKTSRETDSQHINYLYPKIVATITISTTAKIRITKFDARFILGSMFLLCRMLRHE